MDRTRLDSSLVNLASAQEAYDSALKAVADAASAQGSLDEAAAAQLEAARDALGQTRLRLETARTTLDAIRLAELATLDTGDQLLGAIGGNHVLSFFPVGVEAKLEPERLRVRIWPDAISTSTHDRRLTEDEVDAAKRYWRSEAAAADEAASRGAWRTLAESIGVTRAAWAADALTPINRDVLAPGVEPLFPTVAMQDEDAPFVPRASVLPDRWIAIGIRDFVRIVEHVGAPIPMDLAVGLDTTPSETATLSNREGEPIQLPSRMRWMTDFGTAVQVGMALDIPLAADVDRLDELLIIGVRVTQTPAQNAETIASLFTGHRFSRGFAFVPQDTPTNNSIAGGSGLPSGAARLDTAYRVERQPRAFAADVESNGRVAAHAFGLPVDVFARLPDSGATTELSAEPLGFEAESALAMQTALWQVTIGAALEDFLLLPEPRANALREFFRRYVRASGPVPAIRVGRQPYGVLPVTTIDGFVAAADEGIDPRLVPLLRAARTWFAMLRQSPLFDESTESALRHLGRSTKLFAETTQQNSMGTGENRWQTLARSLAIASRNTIADSWRNVRIRGTVESEPQPVTRPIVNETIAAELASLATMSPNSILTARPPDSVLGRIVRHAALLEWSRFARGVCEATLDVPSREDLSIKAMLGGSEVYIAALVQAMFERPTGPGGSVGDSPVVVIDRTLRPRIDDDLPEPPEPPEPPDTTEPPDRPDPPPPPGEPEINATERQRIRGMVGSLVQPLASCPGAARLASFRSALAQLARLQGAELEAELFRTLDAANHRLDAWFTALASRRLATIRASNPQGLVIGGWGCLLDVRRSDHSLPHHRAEFIHTPSLDQAAAAAVLRSGARRAQKGGSNHADVDLSSRRVRLARWILEGIRNGRSISDLLGSRFERAIKGTPAENQLGDLRARFPGWSGKGVLDGLKMHAEHPSSTDPDVNHALSAVDDAVDAVADALTAEAVYQIVRGNPAGALVNLEALTGGAVPPELRVTETPASGVRVTHRIAVAMPAHAVASGWQPNISPRARAEPLLDAWCGCLLGPADQTMLIVEDASGTTVNIALSKLAVGAIDVVLAGRNHGAELAELVVHAAVSIGPISAGARVRADRAWKDLVGLCSAMARALTGGEVLAAHSFDPPSAMAIAANEEFGDLPRRVTHAVTELSAIRDALIRGDNPAAACLRAAAFGIRVPGALLGVNPTAEQQDGLLAATEARLAAVTGTPRDRFRAVFGGDLPGVVTFTARDPERLATTVTPPPTSLLGGGVTAPRAWLDAVGRIHPNVAALSEVLLRTEITSRSGPAPLVIAQVPWNEGDRWIATTFTSTSGQWPAGQLSVLVHAPAGFTASAEIGGLLVDTWTETIPDTARDTAMALRFNNASTRAPQTILLAVNPNPTQPWTTDTIVDVLRHTLVLARIRMQPSTTFSRGGLMPLVWLGQRPGNTGISFAP